MVQWNDSGTDGAPKRLPPLGADASAGGQAQRLGRLLKPAVIAIDGPAASGKSTVGYALAEDLNYLFFDTGVMYRAVTWAALQRSQDVCDGEAIGALTRELPLDIMPPSASEGDGRQCTVLVGCEDVTFAIRSPPVDRNVSAVSAHGSVREALTAHQRRIGLRYGSGEGDKAGIVMVGRDIGTVVMPDAPLKVYLDATAEERARRRFKELAERGRPADRAQVLEDINRRDQYDSSRALAPLHAAADAFVLDTTELTPREAVDRILLLLRAVVEA